MEGFAAAKRARDAGIATGLSLNIRLARAIGEGCAQAAPRGEATLPKSPGKIGRMLCNNARDLMGI